MVSTHCSMRKASHGLGFIPAHSKPTQVSIIKQTNAWRRQVVPLGALSSGRPRAPSYLFLTGGGGKRGSQGMPNMEYHDHSQPCHSGVLLCNFHPPSPPSPPSPVPGGAHTAQKKDATAAAAPSRCVHTCSSGDNRVCSVDTAAVAILIMIVRKNIIRPCTM